LLGITNIRDDRCLLTAISIPLENKQNQNLNNSYQKLEKVWTNWYQKWENNFPKF
jgi:cyanosortase A-associated protein